MNPASPMLLWLCSLPQTSGTAPETQEPPAIAAAIAETAPLPRSELAPAADPGIEVEPAPGTSSPAGANGAAMAHVHEPLPASSFVMLTLATPNVLWCLTRRPA